MAVSAGASVGASVKFHPSRDFVFPKRIIGKDPVIVKEAGLTNSIFSTMKRRRMHCFATRASRR